MPSLSCVRGSQDKCFLAREISGNLFQLSALLVLIVPLLSHTTAGEIPLFDAGLQFDLGRLRRRTPEPPPFSSMNSTPALSSVRRIAKSLGAVIAVLLSVSSARRMVVIPTADSRAKSAAVQRSSARAALICALVSLRDTMLTYSIHVVCFIPSRRLYRAGRKSGFSLGGKS